MDGHDPLAGLLSEIGDASMRSQVPGGYEQSVDPQTMGRMGDELLLHVSPEELAAMQMFFGPAGTNPYTGNPEAFWFLPAIGAALAGAAGTAGTALAGAAGAIGSGIGQAAGAIGSGLGQAAGAVGSGLGQAAGAVGTGLEALGTGAIEAVQGAGSTLLEGASGAGEALKGLGEGAIDSLGEVGGYLQDAFTTADPMEGINSLVPQSAEAPSAWDALMETKSGWDTNLPTETPSFGDPIDFWQGDGVDRLVPEVGKDLGGTLPRADVPIASKTIPTSDPGSGGGLSDFYKKYKGDAEDLLGMMGAGASEGSMPTSFPALNPYQPNLKPVPTGGLAMFMPPRRQQYRW